MQEPLISVIIPAYNAEKLLSRCLKSVCGQTWKNLEILAVDDGSTDGTLACAQSFAAEDARVRVIHQANAGVSAARNAALKRCSGEWIRFVDADDELPPESIAQLARTVLTEKSDLVMAAYEEVIIDALHKVRDLAKRSDTVSCDEYLAFLNPNANSFFCGVLWNKLFRRDLIESQGLSFMSGLNYGEDFIFVCQYLREADRVSFSRDVVYRYIRHPGSLTFSQTMDSIRHPMRNIRNKKIMYNAMRDLYHHRGQYERYRRTLWLYLFRVTVNM